jgi:hypothetical protein
LAPFFLAEDARPLLKTAGEVFIRHHLIGEALLPFAFKPSGDKSVVWVDGAVAPLRALGFIRGPLCSLAPLLKRRLVSSGVAVSGERLSQAANRLQQGDCAACLG